MPELLQDSRRKFIEFFSINKRATVANEFLDVIRSGESVPGRVVNKVLQKTFSSSPYNSKFYIADAIQLYRHDALEYAEHCYDYEQLSKEEKKSIKQARGLKAIKAYMAKQPATDKQIKYLKALGYTGPTPESKADASELISTIKVFNKI